MDVIIQQSSCEYNVTAGEPSNLMVYVAYHTYCAKNAIRKDV